MSGISDSFELSLLLGAFVRIAEEMGVALKKSAYSPNIKERMDHSCAVFDAGGQMIAQAEHIPAHLGAMPSSVKAVLDELQANINEGDSFILNDPYRGGTHLPDITLVSPVFHNSQLSWFTASRAHHADVGGKTPGSMAGDATEVYQEGLIIPPVKLTRRGELDQNIVNVLLSNVRTPNERLGDLRAQMAAAKLGERRIKELYERYTHSQLSGGKDAILRYSEGRMRQEISRMKRGVYTAHDFLDDDGVIDKPVKLRVKIRVEENTLNFDYSGTSPQTKGPLNAVYSVTLSSVYFVVRCVTDPTIPPNAGCYKPITVRVPEGTVLNPRPPAAVAGGNVETSQRSVDLLFRAFAKVVPKKVYAACAGSMNNVTVGGLDPFRGGQFAYYETVAGGLGARHGLDGIDGIHTNMTNTANTPVEAIEHAYPLRVLRYEFRERIGGLGRWRGGVGLRRVYEVLSDEATVSILGERSKFRPWGLFGGEPGRASRYLVRTKKGKRIRLRSKQTTLLGRGSMLIVETAGGGGYGRQTGITT